MATALIAALLLGSCTSSPTPPPEREQPTTNSSPTVRAESIEPGSVLFVLPLTNILVGTDPRSMEVGPILDLDETDVGAPSDVTLAGDRVIVTGAAPGGIVSIDPSTGESVSVPRMQSLGVLTTGAAPTLDGSAVYVAGNEGDPSYAGALFTLRPGDLELTGKTLLPTRTHHAPVVSRDGTVWIAGSEEGPGRGGLLAVPPDGEPVSIPLRGHPQHLALTPRGTVLATLYSKDAVIEVNNAGSVVSRLPGVGTGPLGIALSPSGTGVVAAEGAPDTPGHVHFVDFNEMEPLRSVQVDQAQCLAPREVVIAEERAFVSCLTPPTLLVYDLRTFAQLEAVPLESFTDPTETDPWGDDPRGLVVLERTL